MYCYQTFEPFFYFQRPNESIENILIIENKDTFFSLKKLLQDNVRVWNGINISILIYGEGNKITKSIQYIEEIGIEKNVPIYYFGDLDPEGIAIYNRANERTERDLLPFTMFYKELWECKHNKKKWKNQSWNTEAISNFFSYFDNSWTNQVIPFLEKRNYLPQEALNIELLRRLSDGYNEAI
ncbi:Wadjet anti-phage system protein JetD domain-containing protein [Priestia sp. SB1]|uniref:Wadjet anti-phage system protein JetD domain-containing protein n=1 Tax=Priestia sp. SB1 TaxID=3132359 RepID=UPI003177151B